MGPEQSVAATKTYSGTLMTLAMLSAQMDSEPTRGETLKRVPHAVSEALAQQSFIQAGVQAYLGYTGVVVVGRGYNYSTAFEIALKIKEVSRVASEAYSMADLMHGPVTMVDAQLPVLLVAPSGVGSDESPSLVARLHGLGAKVIVISDKASLLGMSDLRIPMPHVPEWLSPLVAIVPGQLWALELSLARGCDPDHPKGLSKVTRTR
jgi:glucosamine--fructose-6-phosphate aminotransferase (isomerizing)